MRKYHWKLHWIRLFFYQLWVKKFITETIIIQKIKIRTKYLSYSFIEVDMPLNKSKQPKMSVCLKHPVIVNQLPAYNFGYKICRISNILCLIHNHPFPVLNLQKRLRFAEKFSFISKSHALSLVGRLRHTSRWNTSPHRITEVKGVT